MEGSAKEISIVLCGAAGQGIATVEALVTKILKNSGLNVFSTQEFMSRVRGGTNSTTIRVSSRRVRAYCDRIDVLIPLTKDAVSHVEHRLTASSCIIGDKALFEQHPFNGPILLDVSFIRIAEEIGNKLYSNSVAVGVIAGLFQVKNSIIAEVLSQRFDKKGPEVVNKNIEAANSGCGLVNEIIKKGLVPSHFLNIPKTPNISNDLFLSGRDAVALGAIAGGCNYVTFYPMAPSTGIGTFLAQNRLKFGIISDQSEDELSVINKSIGAWYAGARALVTTSGGGFALMTEALSLAGITEMPLVIHLGQRPGPATGMPTRTEQGDLELALYGGHGEFPRILLAPGSLEEAFILSQEAFNLADKFQVPIIILTDHYFINSRYNLPSLNHEKLNVEKHIVETTDDYKRYEFTESGISPRGVPGYGKGFVRVDSHTHTPSGYITESEELRTKMVNKRLKKLEMIAQNIIPPTFVGDEEYETLIVAWGSTFLCIEESIRILITEGKKIGLLHFSQVYPIHQMINDYLKKAEKSLIIENNATSHFGKLIKLEIGHEFDEHVLKYSGYPFSVEEITKRLRKLV
ncbi:MAG: 2-oxoacid:acceptor oxidoreductase subunit alpha [Candidatus Hodarchaeales archaeon]|jgi:2-oxoglutarate ferredoxin oxidoreductase subunit alpha